MDNLVKPSVTARKFVEARPDRFALAMGGVNLLRPVPSLRELTAVVSDLPVAYAAVGPSFWGDGQYPPSDAVYYPLYAKCAELELPLCINTGLPGPPIPGEVQNPIHLDRVCVRFPELKLCMIHGADPWWDIAIRLLIKYAEPAPDDVGVVAEAVAGKPAALHADPRAEQGDLRVGLAGAARCAASCPRRWRWTCPPTCSTTISTTTRRNSSSAGQRGALTMDRYELRRLDYSLSEDHQALQAAYQRVLQDPLPDRNRARRGGVRLRQEPVGAVVRHGRDDDGAAANPSAATARRWST